jgi:WD40 repeat protein
VAGQTGTVFSLSWSPNGARIAAGSADHTIQVWDAATCRHLFTCQPLNTGQISAFAWSTDSTLIAVGSLDQTARLYDGATGKSTDSYEGFSGPVYAIAWSPDGTLLAW